MLRVSGGGLPSTFPRTGSTREGGAHNVADMLFLLFLLIVLPAVAVGATVRMLASDGYGRVPTDPLRVPDRV